MPQDVETYNDLIFKLGDLARERLGGKPNPPRSMDRVLKAEEALGVEEEELKAIEGAMDEEESAVAEFRQAVDEERGELMDLIKEFKKAVDVAEGKYKKAKEKIASKQNDLKHAKTSASKAEDQIDKLISLGERKKADEATLMLKNVRMDVMRRQREINEMEEEAEGFMNPSDDLGPPAQAIRGRARMKDLDRQMEEREKLYTETMAELNEQAGKKEQQIQAARDYYDQAIFLLGEDVYKAKINDSALVPLYSKLDKAQ